MAKFPKPKFETLLANYSTDASSVHACRIIDPTLPGINTCAARMSEALVLANGLVKTRTEIGNLGTGRGDGRKFLLGKYRYPTGARLCSHGIGRGARDMGDFVQISFGRPFKSFSKITDAPPELDGLTGIVVFIKIPGFSGQGHIDLWNKDAMVGHGYWDSKTVNFYKMA